MFNFALEAALRFRTDAASLSRVKAQVEQQVGGIKSKVDVQVDPRALANVNQLATQFQSLQASMKAAAAVATQTSAAVDRMAGSFGRVAGQAAGASSGMQGTAAAARRSAAAAKEAGASFEEFGRQVGLAGRRFAAFNVASSAMNGVARSLREGVREAVEMDLQLNRLAQVSGDTAAGVREVGTEVSRLSTSLGVSSRELAESAVTLKQAGLSTREVKTALDGIAKASLAPNFKDQRQIVEASIASYQQFGRSVDSLADRLGALNAVAGDFAVEAGDLATAVQKAGGTAAQTGGQFNELLAVFTSVRATTRESADSISTGLRTIFTRLQRNETVESLRDLGINLRYAKQEADSLGDTKLEGQFVGMYDAVRRLSEGLSKIRTSDPRFAAAIEELGGYRQVSRVIPLIQQFGEAQKALNVARLGSASLEAAAATRQDALATKFAKTREEFQKFINELVQSKAFKSTVDTVLTLTNALIGLASALKPILPMLTALAAVKVAQGLTDFGRGVFQAFTAPTGSTVASPQPRRLRFERGGFVPGEGTGDVVDAKLEPKEFVVRKWAAQKLGYGALKHINRTGELPRGYANGGEVNGPRWVLGGGGKLDETSEYVPTLSSPLRDVPAEARKALGPLANNALIQAIEILTRRKKFAAGGEVPDIGALVTRILSGMRLPDDLAQEAAVRMLEKAAGGPTDPAKLEEYLKKEARRGAKAFESREDRHRKRFVTGATNASGNPVVDSVAAREARTQDHPFDAEVRRKAAEFSLAGRYASTLNKSQVNELVELAVERGELDSSEASAVLGRPYVTKSAAPPTVAEQAAQAVPPRPAVGMTTALAVPGSPGATRLPSPPPSNRVPDAEYGVVGPRLALPPGPPPLALPPGPPKPLALPPHVEPSVYGLAAEPIALGSPVKPVTPPDRLLAGGRGVTVGDTLRTTDPALAGGRFEATPDATDPSGLGRSASYSRAGYAFAREQGGGLPLAADPSRLVEGYASAPILNVNEETAAKAAADRVRERAEVNRALREQGLKNQGLTTGDLAETLDSRTRNAVSRAGGPALLSHQTMGEVADREHARAVEELTKGVKRQVQALQSGITAVEAERKARELAERALADNAAVLRNRRGEVVGTAALGNQLAAAGQDAAGRGRFAALGDRLGAVGRGLGTFGRSFTPAGGMVGAYAATLAAPVLGSYLEPDKAQVDAAAASGNTGSLNRSAAAGGLLLGGATGAGVGLMFGPLGAAVGGVVGGLAGLVTSLRQAEGDIREAKLGDAVGKLGSMLSSAASGLGGTTALGSAVLDKELSTVRGEVERKVRDATVGWFSDSNAAETAAVRSRETRAAFGGSAGSMVAVLSRQADELARKNPGRDTRSLSSQFAADPVSQSLMRVVADVRGVPVAQVLREFTESIATSQRQLAAQRDVARGQAAAERTAGAMSRLADAVSDAAFSMNRFEAGLSATAAVFSGSTGAIRSTPFAGAGQLGSGVSGADFRKDASIVTGALGPAGQSLMRSLQAADQVGRVLPSVLGVLGESRDPGENLQVRSRELLLANLLPDVAAADRQKTLDKNNPELSRAVDSAVAGLIKQNTDNEKDGGIGALLRQDPGKVAQQANAAYADANKGYFDQISRDLSEAANRFGDGLAQSRQQAVTAGESQDRAGELGLAALRARAEVAADRTGRVGTDLLSLRDLQRPFEERQGRLAGGIGLDPAALAARLREVTARIPAAVQARDAARGSQAGLLAAETDLGKLTAEASNLQAALRNLTNVSERAAAAQDKLAAANSNRDGRLGYAKSFLMAAPEQQMRLRRGQEIVGQVDSGKAALSDLSPDEKRLFIETTDAMGQTRLRSGRTASGLQQVALGGLPGVLDRGQENERAGLQDQVVKMAADAAKAQQAVADFQRATSQTFLADLKSMLSQFFARVATNTAAKDVTEARGRLTAAQAERGDLSKQEQQAALLRKVGVRDQAGLTSLRASQGDLSEYLRLTRDIQGTFAGKPLADGARGSIRKNVGTLSEQLREDDYLGTVQDDAGATATLRDMLSGFGLDRLDGEAQAAALKNIKERFNETRYGGTAEENKRYTSPEAQTDLLERLAKDELTGGRAATAGRLEKLRQDPGTRLAGKGVDLNAVVGLGEGERKALEAAVGNVSLDFDALGQKVRDTDAAIARFRQAVSDAEVALRQARAAEPAAAAVRPVPVERKAAGGSVFRPQGTDTVPAMLTPGEFVVRAASAQANLPLLKSINEADGPLHLANGGPVKDWRSNYKAGPDGKVYYVGPGGGMPDTPATLRRKQVGAASGGDPLGPVGLAAFAAQANQANAARKAARWTADAPSLASDERQNLATFAKELDARGDRGKAAAVRKRLMSDAAKKSADRADEMRVAAGLVARNDAMNARGLGYQQALFRGGMLPGEEGMVQAAGDALAEGRAFNNRSFQDTYGTRTYAARTGRTQGTFQTFADRRRSNEERQREAEQARTPWRRRAATFRPGSATVITPSGTWQEPLVSGRPTFGFADGGVVPGNGTTDSVSARLMPGEYVMSRAAVQNIGAANLDRVHRFASGGSVPGGGGLGGGGMGGTFGLAPEAQDAMARFASQSKELATALTGFGPSAQSLTQAMTSFTAGVEKLAGVIEKFPSEINHQFSGDLNVVVNGTEALAGFEDDLKNWVMSHVRGEFQRQFTSRLPDAGGGSMSNPTRVT